MVPTRKFLSLIVLILNLLHSIKSDHKRPQISIVDGSMQIIALDNGNISLSTSGRGFLNFNGHNINDPTKASKSKAQMAQTITDLQNDLIEMKSIVDGTEGFQHRLQILESKNNLILRNSSQDRLVTKRVNNLRQRIARIEDKLKILFQGLIGDSCSDNPCQNGGRCQNLVNNYICFCPENWEGSTCKIDVNECSRFAGTDLGCQNGATCINKLGSYECQCTSGYFGLHCTRKNASCNLMPPQELCGHGLCVSQSKPPGYKCICEQGWTTNASTPSCTIDVNECETERYPCSTDPLVPCVNIPDGFKCGSCPSGFTGTGFYCSDINECLEDNGGCSKLPFVPCINVPGSRRCGLCPPGYFGDGITCQQKASCAINNGGCHPLAICITSPSLFRVSKLIQCQCPENYQGTGIGPNGCLPIDTPCASNPCGMGGRCQMTTEPPGFKCDCEPFFSGSQCENYDRCAMLKNPCRNNGTCINSKSGYRCNCTEFFTGSKCEIQREICGGNWNGKFGILKFPSTNSLMEKTAINCAWTITVEELKNVNISFVKFNLKKSPACTLQSLKIYDGASSKASLLGNLCGDRPSAPIVTSSNVVHLLLHSKDGVKVPSFNLTWAEIDTKCNSLEVNKLQGEIKSPKYPEDYPNNKDCYWRVLAPPGKRIQLQIHTLNIGTNPNCSYDYLEIFNGFSENHRLIQRYCNTSYPKVPVKTPGSQTLIHFHSNNNDGYPGFHITYTIVEGIPNCGGIFTQTTGEITSPTTNNDYLPNVQCEYLISMPQGLRIQLTFLSFDLETSNACEFDYLEIRDGAERSSSHPGHLVGRYCGKQGPSSWISSTNLINILFESDWTHFGRGFLIKYEAICGETFTEHSATITSPGYPRGYSGFQKCVYEIQTPPGFVIKLNFIKFNVGNVTQIDQCTTDFLEIRDGDSETTALIGRYCGTNEMAPTSITSTHNSLYLKFRSTVSGLGFLLNYTTIDVGCGGILRKSIGVIQSPKEVDLYPTNSVCKWIIIAPPGDVIQLTWITFSLEKTFNCTADYVLVYEDTIPPSNETSEGLIGRFCGLKLPPTIISYRNVLSIQFRSDHSKNSYGFVASYLMRNGSNICGRALFAPSGTIQSSGYPDLYPMNQNCVWTIHVPVGQQILLTFGTFSIKTFFSCQRDYLEIRNGAYGNSPLLGTYCGDVKPMPIVSLTNQLYLKFRSGNRRGRGFEIFWETMSTGCGGTISSNIGHIISPNYPEPYGRNAECYWRVVTSAGSYIQVVFYDIDLETNPNCHYDYIEFHNGLSISNNPIGRYCDENYPPSIQTTSNQLFVKFRSDLDNQRRGFNIKYSTICNNTISGFSGAIESPNYPNPYPNNMDCVWTIIVPRGNKINIAFPHFDLEMPNTRKGMSCAYDFVAIKNPIQDSNEENLVGKFCGNKAPDSLTSEENSLTIQFHTDLGRQHSGFRLEWVIDGCGGKLTNPTGSFSTPNYPKVYPASTVCEWLINVDFMSSIQLNISDLNIEQSDDCLLDGLKVFNGPDANSPCIFQVCGTIRNSTIVTSSGNLMFVRFFSDWSYSGRGFQASYKSVPTKCGGLFINPQGTIHSRNYPKNYENNDECFWMIKIPDSYLVQLTFLDAEFEKNQKNCSNDFIKIFDGDTIDAPVLLTFCGHHIPDPIVSTGNQMLVQMKTDILTNDKGFNAFYTIACGKHIKTESFGIISSNDFGKTTIEECSWTVEATKPGDHVSLTFTYLNFDTSLTDSKIVIYEGFDTNGPIVANITDKKIPPTFVSHGQVFHIHIHGNGIFDYTITYSTLNTACGGALSSIEGEFASLGYPENYPLNADCVWTINPSAGNRVSLRFLQFDVETSPNCNTDFVEVREEGPNGRQLLKVLCGNDLMTNDLKASNLWIHFRSDEEGTARGFLAYYSVFGGELNGTEGRIQSPFYPKSVRAHSDYFWTVTVPDTKIIQIQFLDVDVFLIVETCFESGLKIYDGPDMDAPSLYGCSNLQARSVTSTSNVVYIELQFGDIRTFDLQWNALDPVTNDNVTIIEQTRDERCALVTLSTLTTHGNEATAGDLKSPGFPHGYDSNLRCEWKFMTNPIDHINIKFVVMDLEKLSPNCDTDYVQIYSSFDTPLEARHDLGKFCLSNVTKAPPIQSGNKLAVKFVTDQSNNGTGFQAHIYDECGGEFRDSDGILTMTQTKLKSYFDIYNSNTPTINCTWKITVRQGRKINFRFEQFHVKFPSRCQAFVQIQNGTNVSSNESITYCSYNRTMKPVPLSQTYQALVHFSIERKYINNFENFTLIFSEVALACGDTVVLTRWTRVVNITSPNYPEIPDSYVECEWTIRAPPADSLVVDFIERFDLTESNNCIKSAVELYDGASTIAPLITKRCDDTDLGHFKTSSNVLLVRYFNRVSQPKNGFKAQISIAMCGGTFRAANGTITSPNFSVKGSLTGNLKCTWTVTVMHRHGINLKFTSMHLPKDTNCSKVAHVEIREMFPPTTNDSTPVWNQLGVFCGSANVSSTISAVGYKVEIVLDTLGKAWEAYEGFSLDYVSVQDRCGEALSGPEGIFTSPGYPIITLRHDICRWSIHGPEGRRIKLEFLDFDLGNHSHFGMIMSNDKEFDNTLQSIVKSEPNIVVKSSSNELSIYYWVSYARGRGFKAKWTTDEPTICQGQMTGAEGSIGTPQVPDSESNKGYICTWFYRAKPFQTLALTVHPINTSTTTFDLSCTQALTNIVISQESESKTTLASFCKVFKEPVIVRSPFVNTKLRVRQSRFSSEMHFTIDYKINECGGVMKAGGIIKNPTYPNNRRTWTTAADCAWLIKLGDDLQMKLTFTDFDLNESCDKEFVMIRNGQYIFSPVIGTFCGKTIPDSFQTSRNSLWIEYHSSVANATTRGFKLLVEEVQSGCGGFYQDQSLTIMSPGYPKSYQNNMECLWEVRVMPNYHIGLAFEDIFQIETSDYCTKDYIEVFDKVDKEWISMGRACGRDGRIFNTTSNFMRILFMSNGNITGHGFKARWTSNCGGTFYATQDIQQLSSPGYPHKYGRMLLCNYTIIAPHLKNVLVTFTDFNVESDRYLKNCPYDKVSIFYRKKTSLERQLLGEYCDRKEPPTEVRSFESVQIVFRTDQFFNFKGFALTYTIDKCGGDLISSGLIASPNETGLDSKYQLDSECVWNITAPSGQLIVLRFKEFELEMSRDCYYDYVAIYDSVSIKDEARLAKLCGNLTLQPPVVQSFSNHMLVVFKTDLSVTHRGFKALVLFTPGPDLGCGGQILLTLSNPKFTLKMPFNRTTYQPLLDCHWSINGPRSSYIAVTIVAFHVTPCTGVVSNSTNLKCQCDFVEIYDGPGPVNELLLRHCGHTIPKSISSSTNDIWFRFVSDDTTPKSTGFIVNFESKPAICGETHLTVTNQAQTLTSPNFPNDYPPDLRCKWILKVEGNKSKNVALNQIDLHIETINLEEADSNGRCSNDRLDISDKHLWKSKISENFGSDLVWGGSLGVNSFLGSRIPSTIHTFCGRGKPFDYYSGDDSIVISFTTNEKHQAQGFKINYQLIGCNRNYTGDQGRIKIRNSTSDCLITITAPENATISLYFETFTIFDSDFENCHNSGLRVYDGPNKQAPLLRTLCGFLNPNPIFSSNNSLLLYSWKNQKNAFDVFDLTYTTTSKGQGCGGTIYNYGGRFTSPLYPNPYRRVASCQWDISTPAHTKLVLQFVTFNIGSESTCDTNYIEIKELSGATSKYRFCGGETPAAVNMKRNLATIIYTTSTNNDGQGWDIRFFAKGYEE